MKEYIEREAAYAAIKREESGDSFDFNEGLISAMNAIDSIPAAEGGISMGECIFAAVTFLIGFFFGFLCGRSGT